MPLETSLVNNSEEDIILTSQKKEEEEEEIHNNDREKKEEISMKSPVAEATEDFLKNEIKSYDAVADESLEVAPAENSATISEPPQIVDVSYNNNSQKEIATIDDEVAAVELNGHHNDDEIATTNEVAAVESNGVHHHDVEIAITNEVANSNNGVHHDDVEEPAELSLLLSKKEESNVNNVEANFEPKIINDDEVIGNGYSVKPALNGTIASELPDYKLPDVVEVKKNFEINNHNVAVTGNHIVPPKKGVLSTNIDSQAVKKAYQDVRNDASETQWAIFKFEGPTIVTSATGADFDEFKTNFADDERAFAYIRVQTGDELSRRAKFLFFTWVGANVGVLKRAKMSTDKALIKDIVSNFAVELQTENLTDVTLQNFETELDKAAGAHYGTGIRS